MRPDIISEEMVIVTTHLWAGHAGCGGMLSTWLENLINRVNTVDTVARSSGKVSKFQE